MSRGTMTDEATSHFTLKATRPEDWMVEGGEMGRLIRTMNWARTPLGPISSWPQSLRTTVSLCVASNFPISLAWGPKHIQIYNDGYWPICGAKHPHSMGQDFTECWASAWPAIGEAFEGALAGRTSYLENQRMFLDRNGYLEETFFTFSFSPIRDETGSVGGLFHPVTETTSKMLNERRTRSLRDLAARAGKARTIEEAFHLSSQTLSESELDLPFLLFYLIDAQGKQARLVTRAGLSSGSPLSPATVPLNAPQSAGWPLLEVSQTRQARQVNDLEARFGPFACGPYPEPAKSALVLPIVLPGCEQAAGILIAGISSRLPLNETYRAYCDLLAAGVTTAAATACAYEAERKRAEALAEIDQAKTAFFSNVSHEFRTPLTLILGPLEDELAERQSSLPQARRERLEAAHRNSLRLLKLVNSLLDFSRIEAGRIQASFQPIDLAAYTAELASVFRSAIEKAGLTLMVDCPRLPAPVHVDPEMWEKIVLNLLSNAFKHTFEGGITVALRWCGEHVDLVLSDTGVGITQADQERLFERFHRVKGAKSRTHEGTGIGLALVKELAALHGGTVHVKSKEGQGSTFTVTVKTGCSHLPPERVSPARDLTSAATSAAAFVEEAMHWLPAQAAPARVPTPCEAVCAPGSGDPTPPPAGPRPRILLADDNADMRDYVRRLLLDRYEVVAVTDGAAALSAARAAPPDLVVSDVMMPGLDGFGLLRELRAEARTQTIPVILLSARAGEEAAVEGLDAGADDYVVKPFSARELLARVRTHLEIARIRRAWAKDLELSNKELETFSYSVSHDLRAPLRAIDGFSRILLEDHSGSLDEDGKRVLNTVVANVRKMDQLISAILTFTRMGRTALQVSSVHMTELARAVLSDLLAACPERKIEAAIADLPEARGDAVLLRQVFANLIGNAIKYTKLREVARIEVGARCEAGQTVYFVKDNGVGFDMQYVNKLFGVFQRLHRAEEYDGNGVGLAIVQRIVQRHGGRVWTMAEPDKGAEFYFTLGG